VGGGVPQPQRGYRPTQHCSRRPGIAAAVRRSGAGAAELKRWGATRSRSCELFPSGWRGNHLFHQVNLPV
jgi:hypothetical protein